jgi:hypothetical protein
MNGNLKSGQGQGEYQAEHCHGNQAIGSTRFPGDAQPCDGNCSKGRE